MTARGATPRFRPTPALLAVLAVCMLAGCGRAGDLRKPYHEPVAADAAHVQAARAANPQPADARP